MAYQETAVQSLSACSLDCVVCGPALCGVCAPAWLSLWLGGRGTGRSYLGGSIDGRGKSKSLYRVWGGRLRAVCGRGGVGRGSRGRE